MPDGTKILEADALAAKLGPVKRAELVAYARELQDQGRSADEVAQALRERFRELDDWLPPIIRNWIGR